MSREIDREISTKVFGNNVFSIGGDDPLQEGHQVKGTRRLPNYSTDISAAWLVVEEMRKIGYNAVFYMRNDNSNVCVFSKADTVKDRLSWAKNPAPLAITKAALKALENES